MSTVLGFHFGHPNEISSKKRGAVGPLEYIHINIHIYLYTYVGDGVLIKEYVRMIWRNSHIIRTP